MQHNDPMLKSKAKDETPNSGSVRVNADVSYDFGDYAIIEQKRFGTENEQYLHKVIGCSRSNTWVDVPVQSSAEETMHEQMEDVVRCICCGVDERKILRYRKSDLKPHSR